MRDRFLCLLAAGLFLLPSIAVGASQRAAEENHHSENVRQIGVTQLKLNDGAAWETSTIAFEGNILVTAGGFDYGTETSDETSTARGIGVFRILDRRPYLKQLSFHDCPSGQQGDISIWHDFVFVSIKAGDRNALESALCNNTDKSAGKAGIRVVDISDPRVPRQVKFVETSCGSGTHSLVPSQGRVYIYDPNGGSCPSNGGSSVPSFRMEVIEFDPERPRQAEIVSAPNLNTQDGCMDIAVLKSRQLMACMMLFHASLYDISDPLNPRFIKEITPPGATNMHQASFSWDGGTLILADQGEGGGFTATCTGEGSTTDLFFYDIEDPEDPVLMSSYKAQRVSVPGGSRRLYTCYAWDFSVVPMKNPNRHVAAVGYAAGGMSLIDFSNPTDPREIAYFQTLEGGLSMSDVTHVYWYRGRFYAGEGQLRQGIRMLKVDGFTRQTVRDLPRYNSQTQPSIFD